MFDPLSSYNSTTQRFECGHHHKRVAMTFRGGMFAQPNTPEVSFASVMVCPDCGHAVDINLPAYILESTPVEDALYNVRAEAVWMVQQAMYWLTPVGQAIEAYALAEAKAYRRALQIDRREAKRVALELAASKVKKSWWQRILGR